MVAKSTNEALDRAHATLSATQATYSELLDAGRIFWAQGQTALSIQASNRADRLDPLDSHFQRIRKAIAATNFVEARQVAEDMLSQMPGHPRALYTLAHVSRVERKVSDYLDYVRQGLEVAPGNMILRHMLVSALESAGDEERALVEARRLPEIERSAASILELGRVLQRHGLNQELLDLYASAERDIRFTDAQRGGMELVRGHVLRIEGRADDAIAAYHRSIATKTPASMEAWWALSDFTTYQFSDAEIKDLEGIVQDNRLPASVRCQPAFALAKAKEAQFGLTKAIDDFHRANGLYRPRSFQPTVYKTAVKRIIASVTEEALKRRVSETDADDNAGRPIFVLGMPRSGSTLVEQILASHSHIEGTHELPALPAVKQSLHRFCVDHLGGSYLDRLGDIPVEELEAAGQFYLSQAALFRRENTPFFIDKMPQNFEHIGLIHKILPQAVVIDIRRHPMSCGLSLYRQYFAMDWSWTCDLSHIGTYYRGYIALMDHWNTILPGMVLGMRYEQVVGNTEAAIKTMLDHIGLPYEDACLSFYENRRAVRTPSSEQVRQPIYRTSLTSWRDVERELAPLREALGEALIERYENALATPR